MADTWKDGILLKVSFFYHLLPCHIDLMSITGYKCSRLLFVPRLQPLHRRCPVRHLLQRQGNLSHTCPLGVPYLVCSLLCLTTHPLIVAQVFDSLVALGHHCLSVHGEREACHHRWRLLAFPPFGRTQCCLRESMGFTPLYLGYACYLLAFVSCADHAFLSICLCPVRQLYRDCKCSA